MKRILMALILKIGGIKLSNQIPFSYIVGLVCEKFIERVYAIIRLRRFKSAYVSPSAILRASSKLQYKSGLIIAKGCYIDALGQGGIQCGERVHFGLRTTMIVSGSLQNIEGGGIKIGDNVGLGTHGMYGGAGGVEIGNDCIFGNYVSIHPENHNYRASNIPIRLQCVNHKGIKIGDECWIGAKATILDGTILGNGCIVAAGAVVSGVFPDNVILGGIPAKIIKSRI